ncbi:MAG: TlpA disulfide reductase family protein [Blastocatellales bacterium]
MQSSFIRFSRLNRRQSRLAAFSIAAGLSFAISLALSFSNTEAKPKIGKLPKESVANHQLRMLDGRQFSLAGLRGKVVVLDFFAIWCGHSRHHIPTMLKFGDAEKEGVLQIIGLAIKDSESTEDRVKKFIQEMKITYPVGMISDPEFSDYVTSKDVSVPQTLIYARDGRLAAHFSGHDDKIAADIAATINRELVK